MSRPSFCPFPIRGDVYEEHETLKVFLFGNAGTGSSIWRSGASNPLVSWAKSEAVTLYPIRLPGREAPPDKDAIHFDQNGYFKESLSSLVTTIVEDTILPLLADTQTFALVGVSLGSWIALETSRQLKLKDRTPSLLWLGNLLPPTSPICLSNKSKRIINMSSDELKSHTLKYGARDLDRHWSTFVGQIKPDMALLDDYHEAAMKMGSEPPVDLTDSRVGVYFSEDDFAIPEGMGAETFKESWKMVIRCTDMTAAILPGVNHSWLCNDKNPILDIIVGELDPLLLDLDY